MGTSGSNKGSKRAITPTWVDDPVQLPGLTAPPALAPAAPGQIPVPGVPPQPPGSSPLPLPQVPASPPKVLPPLPSTTGAASLRSARLAFSRAASGSGSGSTRQGLGKSASRYVRAMGGAGPAARAMSPSRRAVSGLGQIVSDIGSQGAANALRPFNLESLAGSPASLVLTALTDVLCPDGGTLDEAIARSAMLETASELAAAGDVAFDALSPAELQAIFLGTISRSITAKLFNELGGSAIVLPRDTAALRTIQATLQDYIQGKVHDAFTSTGRTLASVNGADIEGFVRTIYEGAFSLLEAFGEKG